MLANRLITNQKGFTIVELETTIVLMAIVMITFMAVFTNYLVASSRTLDNIEMTNDSQNLLRVMVEEIRYGAGVRQTNSITDSNAPAGGWNTDNSNFVIITAVPALDSSNQYIIDPSTGYPYMNEFVYYKSGVVLYKRTLANPNATGNKLKTSCPSALASSSCPADRELVDDVSAMTFTLYDQDNNTTVAATQARSIKIDLTLQKETFGSALTFDNTIRITLRNNFS